MGSKKVRESFACTIRSQAKKRKMRDQEQHLDRKGSVGVSSMSFVRKGQHTIRKSNFR